MASEIFDGFGMASMALGVNFRAPNQHFAKTSVLAGSSRVAKATLKTKLKCHSPGPQVLRPRTSPSPRASALEYDVEKRDCENAELGRRDHAAEHRRADAASGQGRDTGREDKWRKAKHEGEASHQHRPDTHACASSGRLFD